MAQNVRRPIEGFALLEVLISLTIVGVALLLVLQLLVMDIKIQRDNEAQREVVEVAEAVAELLRSSSLALRTETFTSEDLSLLLSRPIRASTLTLTVERDPLVNRLWDFRIETEYVSWHQSHRRVLESKIWSP